MYIYIYMYTHINIIIIIIIIINTIIINIICYLRTPLLREPPLDTLQRGVQWIGGAVDWGSII